MNRKEAAELSPFIKAFGEGRIIESSSITDVSKAWREVTDFPIGMIKNFKFRIKPEPKYRPFKDAEECWQEMQKHQPFGYTYDRLNNIRDSITKVATTGVSYDSPTVISFAEIFGRFVFADGVPFGVKVEQYGVLFLRFL